MERTPKRSPEPLSGSMYQTLRKDILQRQFAPGEKLTEQVLCDRYDMSRTPIREAIRQLELEGLIETIPNRGAFVVGLSDQDIKDLYEMRKAYEILAVRWAVERATDEEISAIEELYEFMEFYAMRKDGEKMKAVNSQFHEKLYLASHNRLLNNALTTYQAYTRLTETNTGYIREKMNEVLQEHKAILQAVSARDVQRAVAAVELHVTHGYDRAMADLCAKHKRASSK